jgi:hypothetical protein
MIRAGSRTFDPGALTRSVYFAVYGGSDPKVGTKVGIEKRVKKKGARFSYLTP